MKMVSTNSLLRGTALVILVTAAAYGCKDFLSSAAEPQGTLNASSLATRDGVEGSLVAAYRALDCTSSTSSTWGCAASNWVFGSVASDDSYKGSDALDQQEINPIEGYHWGASQSETYFDTKWTQVYEGVVRANSTIRLLKEVIASSPGEFSTADANGIEGEAIFLRAHYHFEAWRMWGNIPYYREDDTDFRKPNEDSTAVAQDLLKDLDSAIKLLPTAPRLGQKGRASQWTAKAYKGRVQLYDHQYAAALATLNEVRLSGPYALETSFDKVWSAFQSNTNGPETIFAFQASANDGEPNAANANYGERLNFPYAPSHFQCCGFNPPSQNLVNYFRVDAVSGLPLSITSPGTWNASDAEFAAGNMTPVDPRLDWTVGRESVPFKDWGLYHLSWVRDAQNGGFYMPKKNIHEQAAGAETTVGWQPQQQSSINIHLFRYADLLLMNAEAMAETGDLPGAMGLVNQVRARAAGDAPGNASHVAAQGCAASAGTDVAATYAQCTGDSRLVVPINDPSITWATYRVGLYTSFPDLAYAREAIQAERRLELAMEGQRFFDLRRWGITAPVINGYLTGIGGGMEASDARRAYLKAAEPITSKHRWYPIPKTQIDLSRTGTTDNLKQNPGW